MKYYYYSAYTFLNLSKGYGKNVLVTYLEKESSSKLERASGVALLGENRPEKFDNDQTS